MLPETEEGALHSDAYIDALLDGHARMPVRLPIADAAPPPNVRRVIRTIERGMPRYHPSFLFEERLGQQLRALADERYSGTPIAPLTFIERRVVIGGAIASGVSLAGAAMWAWRHRPRPTQDRD